MKSRVCFFSGLALAAVFLLSGCQKIQPGSHQEYPVELKWQRYSVEYQAVCLQVYRQAWQHVKRRAATLQEDWAVVLDVDETVLDNTRYQEILFEENRDFPYYWNEWVKEEKCPAVSGANIFIDSVRTLGEFAHVVYITNRNAPLEESTRNNLIKTGLWQQGDVLLCQQSHADTKEVRRQEVLTGAGRCEGMGPRKIIALIGDQLGDVAAYPRGVAADDYRHYYRKSPQWGVQYFILPNPMYGYWFSNYKR